VSNIIKIICPDNNVIERSYIIKILFSEFLQTEYSLSFRSNVKNYIISTDGFKLEFKDCFFNNLTKPLSYLKNKNIPQTYSVVKNPFFDNLIVIFGDNQIMIKPNHVICDFDIFAASFFLLTRWDELLINNNLDIPKFKETDHFLIKNKLEKRPIVNEYCSFIKNIFSSSGLNIFQNNRKLSLTITHDVDRCHYSSLKELCKNLSFIFFAKKDYKKGARILKDYLINKLRCNNPFDTFNIIMRLSDYYGFKSTFFFKACIEGERGFTYNLNTKKVKDKINIIKTKGHYLGFHPSENTYNNLYQFKAELNRLKQHTKTAKIEGGRNHLLYYNKNSYAAYENEKLEYFIIYFFKFLKDENENLKKEIEDLKKEIIAATQAIITGEFLSHPCDTNTSEYCQFVEQLKR
jgi:hypothetical protein